MEPVVSIYWDLENCPIPSELSGYSLVSSIRSIVHSYGPVASFKAYSRINESTSEPKTSNVRSELQVSGVSLIDCPRNGTKNVLDKMFIVDVAFQASMFPKSTVVLIASEAEYSYLISTLRLRRHPVIVITPQTQHEGPKSHATVTHIWESICTTTVRSMSRMSDSDPAHDSFEDEAYDDLDRVFPTIAPDRISRSSDPWVDNSSSPLAFEANPLYSEPIEPETPLTESTRSQDVEGHMASFVNSLPSPMTSSPSTLVQTDAEPPSSTLPDLIRSTSSARDSGVASPFIPNRTPSHPGTSYTFSLPPVATTVPAVAVSQPVSVAPSPPIHIDPRIPVKFRSLVEVTKSLGTAPRESVVVETLLKRVPTIYKSVGYDGWKQYKKAALEEGIMELRGPSGFATIVLLPYVPVKFRPLVHIIKSLAGRDAREGMVAENLIKQFPNVYQHAGCSSWKAYKTAAIEAGLINIIGQAGSTAKVILVRK